MKTILLILLTMLSSCATRIYLTQSESGNDILESLIHGKTTLIQQSSYQVKARRELSNGKTVKYSLVVTVDMLKYQQPKSNKISLETEYCTYNSFVLPVKEYTESRNGSIKRIAEWEYPFHIDYAAFYHFRDSSTVVIRVGGDDGYRVYLNANDLETFRSFHSRSTREWGILASIGRIL